MTKENTKFLFCISERNSSYIKIMQVSGMTKENTKFLTLMPSMYFFNIIFHDYFLNIRSIIVR